MTRLSIRWLVKADLADVLAIDRASFDRPWSEERAERQLSLRNCIGIVAEVRGVVAGFMVYEARGDHYAIERLAVHPSYRLEGVGKALLGRLLSKLDGRRDTVQIAVRESNLDGQCWLRACGLRAVAVEREHYGDTGEDAYVFTCGQPARRVKWDVAETR